MESANTDGIFAGSIPAIYETYLVPLLFAPYAADLVTRLVPRAPGRVLEVAAGTGVVTRAMDAALAPGVSIVATDLNQPMLDQAAAVGTSRAVEWRPADAMALPFEDASFDAVVCQFGVMFFPDKAKAFAEARRVLRPGGVYLFSVWDRIEENEFANAVTEAVAELFPEDPPRFLARTPHGHHDRAVLAGALAEGGFAAKPGIATVSARSRAQSPRDPAIAFCQGTPLRGEIEARDPARLAEATDAATERISRRFGPGPVEGRTQAVVVAIER